MSNERLRRALTNVINGIKPLDYYAFYSAVTIGDTDGDTVDIRPNDTRFPREGLTEVPIKWGIPGVKAKVASGTRCYFGFEGGNPTLPVVTGWDWSSTSAIEILIQSSSKVTVVSPNVFLAESTASHPVPLGEVVQRLFRGVTNLLQSMAPIGNMGLPVPFATDALGTTEDYGAEGVIAVTGAMLPDLTDAGLLSSKTKTG